MSINQSINLSINLYRAIARRRVLQCGYAESKRNVLRRILNVLTDGAVRQFSGRDVICMLDCIFAQYIGNTKSRKHPAAASMRTNVTITKSR